MSDVFVFYTPNICNISSCEKPISFPESIVKRSLKYINNDKREQFLNGYLFSKYILNMFGIEYDKEVVRNKHGKPILMSDRGYFNLSHCGTHIALAYCAENPVGIDIQGFDDISYQNYLHIFFSKDDQSHIIDMYGFAEMWARKEAFLKCTGYGWKLKGHNSISINARKICWNKKLYSLEACSKVANASCYVCAEAKHVNVIFKEINCWRI